MKIASDVTRLMGNTPLVQLNRVGRGLPGQVVAKLEFFNPAHSVKDRIGTAMVDALEREGKLEPGVSTIIEPTSGNTGIALAMVAGRLGVGMTLIVPLSATTERVLAMQAYGAEVVITPTNAETNSPEGYGGVAERLVNEIPNAWRPDQFDLHLSLTGQQHRCNQNYGDNSANHSQG